MVRTVITGTTFSWLRPALLLASVSAFAADLSAAEQDRLLRLAATTTSDNSGLLERLLPAFENATGYHIRLIIGSSGRALRLLANGDVDIALTHAPRHQRRLLNAQRAINPTAVMSNDFIIVGPSDDPARIAGAADAEAAFRRIAARQSVFLSRGDESGTHEQELAVWQASATSPTGSWYRETGQGMGHTLLMANELSAYTMTDRATWQVQKSIPRLSLLFESPRRLRNQYTLLSANPAFHPHTNEAGAKRLSEWLRSRAAKSLIANYTVNGQALFVPLP